MMTKIDRIIHAIFIGTSAGGVQALNNLFDMIPENFKIPIIVVLHLGEKPFIPSAFRAPKGMKVLEAEEKEPLLPGNIYFAPANYHLLIEEDKTFSLTTEDKIQFARPSLDVTMDSLSQVFGNQLIGIVLTGANEDGADGLKNIQDQGGICIVQDPKDALYPTMPEAAISKVTPDFILNLKQIGSFIGSLKGSYE